MFGIFSNNFIFGMEQVQRFVTKKNLILFVGVVLTIIMGSANNILYYKVIMKKGSFIEFNDYLLYEYRFHYHMPTIHSSW